MNLAQQMIDRMLLHNNPEQICYGGSSLSGPAIAERVHALAGSLRQLQFLPDQRVLLVMKDTPSFVYSFLALLAIGCIPVPLNPKVEEKVMAHILNDARAAGLLIDAEEYFRLEQPLQASPYLLNGQVVVNDLSEAVACSRPVTARYLSHLLAGKHTGHFAYYHKKPTSIAFWQYTSGTTGLPKAVQHAQETMLLNTEKFAVQTLGIGRNDRILSVPKMFFGYGLGNSLFFPLLTGASVLLDPDWPSLHRIRQHLAAYRPTVFFAIPRIYSLLLQHQQLVQPADLQSIRLFFSAGSHLPQPINDAWKAWQGQHIVNGIGSTEIGHVFLCNQPGSVQPELSGWPVDGYHLRVVDLKDGQTEVPVDMPGELCIRPPYAHGRYWENPESNDRQFRRDWFYSGDLCARTAGGGYVYLGRKDDLFKVKGRWVNPAEVEATVLQLFEVEECALVEVKDDLDLGVAALFVVKRAGCQLSDGAIKDTLARHVSSYKCPEHVISLEQLPKNANGKVCRGHIQALYHKAFGQPVTDPATIKKEA